MDNKGRAAEKNAQQWLLKQGLKLVTANYRCRFGEIDLIMQDQSHLVFIEVRLRATQSYGGAASSVDLKKQQKIITTANHFLMCNKKLAQHSCRFDVIAIESISVQSTPVWYKDAFRT
jgi:putative endonuclease